MPIFGKGRAGRETKIFLEKKVYRQAGKRRYRKRKKWKMEGTSFNWVAEIGFPRIFSSFLGERNFIEMRFREKGRPLVVLDWGCGNGRAIKGLAEKYKGKVYAYGYSGDSYKEWKGNQKVKFIHTTKEDLLRYLKDSSVDLIYSHLGLDHLFGNRLSAKTQEAIDYIAKLVPKLSKGGIACFGIGILAEDKIIVALQHALGERATVVRASSEVYITRN